MNDISSRAMEYVDSMAEQSEGDINAEETN